MLRKFTLILGIILLIAGIAGQWVGSHAHHLIIFGVNFPHNAVHLLSGAAAIFCSAAGDKASRLFCLIFGGIYFLVMLLGFLGVQSIVSLLNINMADNFLHLFIAISCLGFGWKAPKDLSRL